MSMSKNLNIRLLLFFVMLIAMGLIFFDSLLQTIIYAVVATALYGMLIKFLDKKIQKLKEEQEQPKEE